MKLVRLFAGNDGDSRFEDIEIPLEDGGPIGRLSEWMGATGVLFRETGADYDWSWHNPPRRQLIVMLEGEVEITAGSGEIRRFGPGEVLLAEDTTGRGHASRAVGGRPRKTLFVALD